MFAMGLVRVFIKNLSCREVKSNSMQSPVFHVTSSTGLASQLFVPKCLGGDGAAVLFVLTQESWKGQHHGMQCCAGVSHRVRRAQVLGQE